MIVLKMNEKKELNITRQGNTYENENNAETLRILFPQKIHNFYTDDNDVSVILNVINQDNVGDALDITSLLVYYDESFYGADILMSNMFTYKSGTIKLWIKVIKGLDEMIAKTNIVSYQIKPHIEIEETMPTQKLSLLDEIVIKLDKLNADLTDIKEYISILKQGEVFLVESENENN